jgi:hypothetical protein
MGKGCWLLVGSEEEVAEHAQRLDVWWAVVAHRGVDAVKGAAGFSADTLRTLVATAIAQQRLPAEPFEIAIRVDWLLAGLKPAGVVLALSIFMSSSPRSRTTSGLCVQVGIVVRVSGLL